VINSLEFGAESFLIAFGLRAVLWVFPETRNIYERTLLQNNKRYGP
jgi:hypothetical protein